MARLLAILLVFSGVGLVAPPAQAAVVMTLQVSTTTVPEGSKLTFTGRAAGAHLGSVVRLQRQRPDGTWAPVASTKLAKTRRYRFIVTPPRGDQRYRVVKPRRFEQRRITSRALTVRVTWRPRVVLGAVSDQIVDWSTGAVVTSTRGATPDLPGGTSLRRELLRADGTWVLRGWVRTTADRTWRDRFASSHGQRFRYVAPSVGARQASASGVLVVDGRWTPSIAAGATVDPLTDTATATGHANGLSAGSTVQLQALSNDQWYDQGVTAVVGADGDFSQTFHANMAATYRFYSPSIGLRRAASSAPFRIGQPAPARVDLNTTTAVEFPSDATSRTLVVALGQDQTFTYNGPYWVTPKIADPSGNPLPGFGPSTATVTAVAPVAGDYIVTLTTAAQREVQTADITLSTPVVVTTAVDAPGVDLESSLPGQVVDLQFDGTAGTVVSAYSPTASQTSVPLGSTLLDPHGDPVPIWGSPLDDVHAWRLPSTGVYTIRCTPDELTGRVSRSDQVVLSASEGVISLDGAPGHITLDRPGRVGVVSVEVPAGLDIRISDTGSAFEGDELFGPDGQFIPSNSHDIKPTRPGTYTLLVADDTAPGGVDYYATTPATIETSIGNETSYDLGPAPDRVALVHVPVTAGQILSLETLDSSGAFCGGSWDTIESGDALVASGKRGTRTPGILEIAQSGELVLRLTPCAGAGSIRINEATVVTATQTDSTVDSGGNIIDTSVASLAAEQPGQLMIVEYDAASVSSIHRLDLRATASTFPSDTGFQWGWSDGRDNSIEMLTWDPVSWDSVDWSLSAFVNRRQFFYVYAGPSATGMLDLEFMYHYN